MVTLNTINTQIKKLIIPCILALGLSPLAANAELLGVNPDLPLMSISGTGTTIYNSSSKHFEVNSLPIAFVEPPATYIDELSPSQPASFSIAIKVDNDGNLVNGAAGHDLSVVGSVNLRGSQLITGTLLTGEIKAFGYKDTGTNNDLYDFVFTVTGGLLADHYAGKDIAVNMNSESSNFVANFATDFSGKAKGSLGAIDQHVDPKIAICTLVTLDEQGVNNFSDADNVTGDTCDNLSQGVPVGVAGEVDGTYKLQVTNNGTETLVDVVINSTDFGLINTPIPANCGDLVPGEVCIIDVNKANFSSLKQNNVCTVPGHISAQAEVKGVGENSNIIVTDEDPAIVNCLVEPSVSIEKHVRMNMGKFHDANTKGTAPAGHLGSDVRYRFIVTNNGTEALSHLVINDAVLGLIDVPLSKAILYPGEQVVVNRMSVGFTALKATDACAAVGTHLNTAEIIAKGQSSGTEVSNTDVAYISCHNPQIELRKEVSVDGVNFFDANLPNDADVPVGLVNNTDVTYRLIVKNIGTERLIDVNVTDQKLAISQTIARLIPNQEKIITFQSQGFHQLKQLNHCVQAGHLENVANVTAIGRNTKFVVSADDPAYVKCIAGVSINIVKQVKFTHDKTFSEANKRRQSPIGTVGDSGRYRFIVTNTGDEPLNDVRIEDAKLGIDKIIANLAVGQTKTIGFRADGFQNLQVDKLCDSVGAKLNTVGVSAKGTWSGQTTNDSDHAYVRCESAPVCAISVDVRCSVIDSTDARYNNSNLNACKVNPLGSNVTFAYKVKNTGDTPVSITGIYDSKLGNVLNSGAQILASGQTLLRESPSILVKKKRVSSVSVTGNTDRGAACEAHDAITVIPVAKPIAANEIGMVRGDPHYSGADGGKWDFHGQHLAMFNLLNDTNLNVNTQYLAKGSKVYLGNTRVVIDNVAGKEYLVQLSVDGSAQVNGRALRSGEDMKLANGTRIYFKRNPNDNELTILPSRADGNRTTSGVLKIWTAEGYYIELAGFNAYGRFPNHVDMAVRSGAKGVDTGRMPSGVLGQSFDADNTPLEYKHVNGWSFQVNNLSTRF